MPVCGVTPVVVVVVVVVFAKTGNPPVPPATKTATVSRASAINGPGGVGNRPKTITTTTVFVSATTIAIRGGVILCPTIHCREKCAKKRNPVVVDATRMPTVNRTIATMPSFGVAIPKDSWTTNAIVSSTTIVNPIVAKLFP